MQQAELWDTWDGTIIAHNAAQAELWDTWDDITIAHNAAQAELWDTWKRHDCGINNNTNQEKYFIYKHINYQ